MIPLKKGDKEYKVRVAVITENYMSHYLYMTPRVYEQTFGEKPEYENIVLLCRKTARMIWKWQEPGSLLILGLSASVIPVVWHPRLTVC